MVRRGQITDPERDWACRHGKSETQQRRVIGRPCVRDTAFGCPHHLIRGSLQPKDSGKEGLRACPGDRPESERIATSGPARTS